MKHFEMRKLMTILCASGLIGSSGQAMASAFQIWEQDIVGVGNYHAGYAAEVNDASSAWYNPAGMTRIKNQQLVFGASGIKSHFKYNGMVGITETLGTTPPLQFITNATYPDVSANGGTTNIVPNLEYVAPVNDWVSFGFSAVAPFGLMTDYGTSSPMRYAATRSSIKVADVSPSLAFKVTEKASLGLGFDLQKAEAEFNAVAGSVQPGDTTVDPLSNTSVKNKARSTGYGFHLGGLYEFTPCTRVGLSYHSQVVHHFEGKSRFVGPIAEVLTGQTSNELVSRDAKTDVTLPGYAALSAFHQITPSWAVMASVIYTQWHVFEKLKIRNAAGAVSAPFPDLLSPSTSVTVVIPEHFHNTWSASVGANYYASDTITMRGGIGYDQTPVVNKYRNVQLPDNDRIGLGLGGHWQANKTVGVDVGWTHIFIEKVKLNPPAQVNGAVTLVTNGRVKGGADVLGAQITWDIV